MKHFVYVNWDKRHIVNTSSHPVKGILSESLLKRGYEYYGTLDGFNITKINYEGKNDTEYVKKITAIRNEKEQSKRNR